MREAPKWLVVLVVIVVVALIAFAGWHYFFGKPKWTKEMPIGETPTGEPIYQK